MHVRGVEGPSQRQPGSGSGMQNNTYDQTHFSPSFSLRRLLEWTYKMFGLFGFYFLSLTSHSQSFLSLLLRSVASHAVSQHFTANCAERSVRHENHSEACGPELAGSFWTTCQQIILLKEYSIIPIKSDYMQNDTCLTPKTNEVKLKIKINFTVQQGGTFVLGT